MEFIEGTTLEIRRADTFLKRFKGLMFRSRSPENWGLLLEPCQSIHMFNMRFSLDIVVLDEQGVIIALYRELKPGKVTPHHKNAQSFIELKSGTIDQHTFSLGQQIQFIKK